MDGPTRASYDADMARLECSRWFAAFAALVACSASGDGSGGSTSDATTSLTSTNTATTADTPTTTAPTTAGASTSEPRTTGEPAVPCTLDDPDCPPDQICEGDFDAAYCVPDPCLGVTCEENLYCYSGDCTCVFDDCPAGMFCDQNATPEACKPDPCASEMCPIFSWCYSDVGHCETCATACGANEVCDQATAECLPIVATAADACVEAPLVVIPPYPGEVWFAGDLSAATTDPAFADCATPGAVEQVVRIQLDDDGTFYFSGTTESLDVHTTMHASGGTCDINGCGTEGVSSGSPLEADYEFTLGYFFDAGTYVLTVSGPPGSGKWWMRAAQH